MPANIKTPTAITGMPAMKDIRMAATPDRDSVPRSRR